MHARCVSCLLALFVLAADGRGAPLRAWGSRSRFDAPVLPERRMDQEPQGDAGLHVDDRLLSERHRLAFADGRVHESARHGADADRGRAEIASGAIDLDALARRLPDDRPGDRRLPASRTRRRVAFGHRRRTASTSRCAASTARMAARPGCPWPACRASPTCPHRSGDRRATSACVDLDVGQSVRFGVQVRRIGAGSADLSDSRCLRACADRQPGRGRLAVLTPPARNFRAAGGTRRKPGLALLQSGRRRRVPRAKMMRWTHSSTWRVASLSPSRRADYLDFFDHERGPAFADNPAWAGCYCHYFHAAPALDGASLDRRREPDGDSRAHRGRRDGGLSRLRRCRHGRRLAERPAAPQASALFRAARVPRHRSTFRPRRGARGVLPHRPGVARKGRRTCAAAHAVDSLASRGLRTSMRFRSRLRRPALPRIADHWRCTRTGILAP